MSVRDPFKLELVRKHRAKKICRTCGAGNDIRAIKCRKCHNSNLRLKRATIRK